MRITRKRLRQIIKEELLLEGGMIWLPVHPAALVYHYYTPQMLQKIIGAYISLAKDAAMHIEKNPLGKALLKRAGIKQGSLFSSLKSGQKNAYGIYLIAYASGVIGWNIGEVLLDAYPHDLGASASGKQIQVDVDNIDFDDLKENLIPYAIEIASTLIPKMAAAPGEMLTHGGDAFRRATTSTASGKLIDPDPRGIDWPYAWEQLKSAVNQ